MEQLTPFLLAVALALITGWWRRYAGRPKVAEHTGVRITHRRRVRKMGRHTQVWTEYLVQLPPPLDALNLIEGDAHAFRTREFIPTEDLPLFGSPNTPSAVFNGRFDYTAPALPQAARVLHESAELRDLLTQLTDVYEGMWIHDGRLRVLTHAHGDGQILDVDHETLASFLFQIEDAIERAGGQTVLDFEEERAAPDEDVAVAEVVEQTHSIAD